MMLVALCSSAQLLMMGILGEYVGRIYEEVKRRPLYTVSESINFAASSQAEANPAEPGPGPTERTGVS
jgi:dolichol-phosphate mannosyltransferase